MITIRLIDARRGLHQQCESLFRDKKIADQIYWYLCDGLEECDDAVKHGRWIKMSDADGLYYCCSECGEELYRSWSFDREFDISPHKKSIEKTMYCPHCGARMDGEENESGR